MPERFILASASPRRRELMALLNIRPVIFPCDLEEDSREEEPERLVLALSQQKALYAARRCRKEGVVIGADTCVFVPGKKAQEAFPPEKDSGIRRVPSGFLLGKPRSDEDASAMIRLLAGCEHAVYTGVTLVRCGRSIDTSVADKTKRSFAEKTSVTVARLTEEEIRSYLATGEQADKAGAYGIQGAFARYITSLRGDYFNVVGLPVARLYAELKEFVPDLLSPSD